MWHQEVRFGSEADIGDDRCGPRPGPKFKYKLEWMKRLLAHAADLYALNAPAVLAGDFNVVPTDADIYQTKIVREERARTGPPR
jgi:exodeoxyribonuclease-3